MENVAHKLKNVVNKETIDDKNLNDSVSINNVDKSVNKNPGQDIEAKRLKEIEANHHLRLIL